MPMRLTILVATMTGTAEMVAQEMEQALGAAGHEADVTMMDGLDAGVFASGGVYLVCTSTYGFGNVPDNAQDLIESLEKERPDLSNVRYGVFALGDSTYGDTFCQGAMRFDEVLRGLGARRVGEVMRHDANAGELPEEIAPGWAIEWIAQLEAESGDDAPNRTE